MDILLTRAINKEPIASMVFRQKQTLGIPLSTYPVHVTFKNVTSQGATSNWHTPSAIIYTSDDGKAAPIGFKATNNYTQHSTTRSDAYAIKEVCEDFIYENFHMPEWESWELWLDQNKAGCDCSVTAVRDHQYVLVRLENCGIITTSTTTLPAEYADKEVYLSITGEACTMSDFKIENEIDPIDEGTITPVKIRNTTMSQEEGDIPNLDCIGWWTAHSYGVPIGEDPVKITYNTISYQQARENFHTPLVVVFSALDQNVGGIAYKEFCVTRSDGFGWNLNADSYTFETTFDDDWKDWGEWLATNKKGVSDCEITAHREDDTIIIIQKNSGVTVKSVIQIPPTHSLPVCLSLSGELCTICNVRIEN